MGTAIATAFGLISLAIGALLGAIIERSRARAGYLAKRYRDHLKLLLDLARSTSAARPSDEVEQLRKQVLNARPAIDADVWLFADRSVSASLDEVHDLIARADYEQLEPIVRRLASRLRGPWYRRLAPQKRWFR
jgi:hypothetical protein